MMPVAALLTNAFGNASATCASMFGKIASKAQQVQQTLASAGSGIVYGNYFHDHMKQRGESKITDSPSAD